MGSVLTDHIQIGFREGRYTIATLVTEDERRAGYRLRHKVFAEMLQWVPCREDGMETDDYDADGISLGIFNDSAQLVAVVRLLPPSGRFMLEQEFRSFLSPDHRIRKTPDTTEITRLTVDPDSGDKGLYAGLMRLLLKAIYQWCLANEVRYCYLEVEQQLFRILRALGFPCERIGPLVQLPPAQAMSLAAFLDLDRFRTERRRPAFVDWITLREDHGEKGLVTGVDEPAVDDEQGHWTQSRRGRSPRSMAQATACAR
jgi:acyl homoserine lactone synthase